MTAAALRIASYNVHRAVGLDGKFAPERVLGVLKEIDADVIALQEVEACDDGGDMLAWLAKETGMNAIAGTTIQRHDGYFGNGLLTRCPVREKTLADLSWRGREPRGAIAADVDCNGRTLRVVATHLGLRPAERRAQVHQILQLFSWLPDDRAILMGDVNEWFLWGRPLRRLHRYFAPTRPVRTFPSKAPMLALDRMWAHPGHILKDLRAHRSALSRVASDHLPLVASVAL